MARVLRFEHSGAGTFALAVSANPMIGDVAAERVHFLAALAWCRAEFGLEDEASEGQYPRWRFSPRDERMFGRFIPQIRIRDTTDRFTFKLRWC